MTNYNYRIKENIVHISIVAGTLLTDSIIEVESLELVEKIIELSDKFENEIYPTFNENEDDYLSMIDIFSHKELLKAFGVDNFHPIYRLHDVHTNKGTFHFFIGETPVEELTEPKNESRIKYLIMRYLLELGYSSEIEFVSIEDSICKVITKKGNNLKAEIGDIVEVKKVTGEAISGKYQVTELDDESYMCTIKCLEDDSLHDAIIPNTEGERYILVLHEYVS